MKKIFTYICAAFLVLGFASCAKESISTTEEPIGMTILATLDEETDTKTSLMGDDEKGYKVVWNAGDVIAVHYNNSMCNFTLTSGAGTTTAEFTAAQSLPDGTYDAYYGVEYNSTEHLIVLPRNVEKVSTPMKASLTITNGMASVARFKNLCGLVRLKVTGYGKITSVLVHDYEKYISGPFDVDSDGRAVVKNHTISTHGTVLDLDNPDAELSSTPQYFYLPLPEGDYSNVMVRFIGPVGGHCDMTLNSGKTLSIKRSEIYPLTFNVNIISGEWLRKGPVIVKWVQLWANGPKWAVYNVGADNNKPESQGKWYDQPSAYSNDDHAKSEWGNNWRTPTLPELKKLANIGGSYTIAKDTTINGLTCTKFTGKGMFSQNSVLLPQGEYTNTTRGSVNRYWTSVRVPGGSLVSMSYDTYAIIRAVVEE